MKIKVQVKIEYLYEDGKCGAVLKAHLPVERLTYFLIPQLRGGSVWGRELNSAPGILMGAERVIETALTANNWTSLKRGVNKAIKELKTVLQANVREYGASIAGMPKNSEVVIVLNSA